jgi:DNA polymerase-3 subunit beta
MLFCIFVCSNYNNLAANLLHSVRLLIVRIQCLFWIVFLFEIKNGQLIVTASDSENVMKSVIKLDECDSDGEFAVTNGTILDALRELAEQPLTFNFNPQNNELEITYQNGNYNFTAKSAEEFPRTSVITDDSTVINIEPDVLAENLNRSLFATAFDELRPVMNGVYFDLTPDCLTIVASDGHKLVRNRVFTIKSENPSSFILPKKPATLLKNVLTKDSGDVVIRFNSRNAEISFADGDLTCRLIEGRYPNYNSVIPQDNPDEVNIDRNSLLGALRRVLPFASESSELIRLQISNGNIELSSNDVDFSTSAKENVTCDYQGAPITIGFKGSSLKEILVNLSSDDVVLKLADPSRAGVIVPGTQPENEEVLMLIMPMLLND